MDYETKKAILTYQTEIGDRKETKRIKKRETCRVIGYIVGRHYSNHSNAEVVVASAGSMPN